MHCLTSTILLLMQVVTLLWVMEPHWLEKVLRLQ
nr:MAG TPA: hypothetical protein [Caudoviricetes sp.]